MTTLDLMYMILVGVILFAIWALIGFNIETADNKRRRKRRAKAYKQYKKKLRRQQAERYAIQFDELTKKFF